MTSEKSHETKSADTRRNSVTAGDVVDIEDSVNRDFYGKSISDSYRLKSELVGKCMSKIGFGRFQWILFIVAGFGGMIDNFWSQGIGTVQPAVRLEFQDMTRVTLSSIAFYAGLIFGASFWGISADFIGRKPAFNMTLLIGGVFALGAGASNSFQTFCIMWAFIGTAAGGNVPVDNMIFLEFIAESHQYLLTTLSLSGGFFGQLVVSLIGWGFIANFTCPSNTTTGTCLREDNMGWRYFMFTLGSITVAAALLRIFVFRMPESPRYLLAKDRDAEAVEAVNFISRFNGKTEPLTIAMLQQIDIDLGLAAVAEDARPRRFSKMQILKENLADYKSTNFKRLFATPRLVRHTSMIWFIWLTIGIAYPLYFNFLPTYLSQLFVDDYSLDATYRSYCIQSAVGMVAPIVAAFLIQTFLGRRYVMGISSVATGTFLFAYTTARSSVASLGFSSILGMVGNLEYSVLFAYTPESFPAPNRGLASGFASALLRFGGLCASLIGTYTDFSVVPIYVAASLWICVGLASFFLPFETHHHAAV